MRSPGERRLDFLVIGASKSGTTTLFHHLRQHSELYLPPEKELPFFSRDEWFDAGWDAFAARYLALAPPESLCGTVTPQYLEDATRAPARIARLFPNVRLIAVLRHPVNRAFSSYRMRVGKGRELRSFEAVIDEQLTPAALERARSLPWSPANALDCYFVTSEYGRCLSAFLEHFDRDQLRVFFTDELEREPGATFAAICRFLNVDPSFVPPDLGRRYYVGGHHGRFSRMAAALRKIGILRWIWHRFPTSYRKALTFWYRTELSVRRSPPPEIPGPLKQRLVEHFWPDIRLLEETIGRPVPWLELRSPGLAGAR